MKRTTLYLVWAALLFSFVTAYAQTGWYWQNPTPHGYRADFNHIFFADQNTGWITGDNLILKTTDAGITWNKQIVDANTAFFSCFFVDGNNGWVSAYDYNTYSRKILKTTDGGATWTTQYSCQEDEYVEQIFFTDIGTGWAVIEDGANDIYKILNTNNGGSSWTTQYTTGPDEEIQSLFFNDSNTGWITVNDYNNLYGKILKTTTGGYNWTTQYTASIYSFIGGIIFFSVDTGYAWSLEYNTVTWDMTYSLLKTFDGGETWSSYPIQVADNSEGVWMEFTNKETGWMTTYYDDGDTEYSKIFKTNNGGLSWTEQYEVYNAWFGYFCFTDENNGYFIEWKYEGPNILQTTNGGASFSEYFTDITYGTNLQSVFFISANTGWTVGYDEYDMGKIMKTVNGGETWSNQYVQSELVLNSVFFRNTSLGWAVGGNYIGDAIILKTSNGGNSWSDCNIGQPGMFNSVRFFDNNSGWAVGSNILAATSNGGSTWVIDTNNTQNINSVYPKSDNFAFICGSCFISSVNLSGENINTTTVSSDNTEFISLCFSNSLTGWAVSRSYYIIGDDYYEVHGLIYKSTNGGNSWNEVYNESDKNFTSIYFTDENNGWISGNPCLKTTDGGNTWEVQEDMYGYSVHFSDFNNGWTVGGFGGIMHTTNAGNPHEICMVTVDPTTGKNMVVIENDDTQGIGSYNIYKEASATSWDYLGSLDVSEISAYIDYSSNPQVHADKYKITTVTPYGIESSQKSPYHKTVNLGISQGVPASTIVLDWDDYEEESGSFIADKYYIYRGTSTGNLEIRDSISSSFTSYNDVNVYDTYFYAIGVSKPGGCNPTGGKTTYNISMSNIETNGTGISENENSGYFRISPNPFRDKTVIEFGNPAGEEFMLTITDITGKVVRKREGITAEKVVIERGELPAGVYTVELRGEILIKGVLIAD